MQGWSPRRAGTRAGAALAAVGLLAGVIVAGSGRALASGTFWTSQKSVNATAPGGQLASISCSSATACTAVGTSLNTAGINVVLAERWNGSSWQRQPAPNPAEDTVPAVAPDLLGVSCPTVSFCEAVGTYHLGVALISLAESWNGSRWKSQPFPFPAGGSITAGMTKVSCTSARFCEAVGSVALFGGTVPLAANWNGTSWRLQYPPVTAGAQSVGFDTVSCVSPTFCEAWGGGTPANPGPAVAERWDGTSWRLQTTPANTAANSVSCVSARFCEAIGVSSSGGQNDAAVWNGSSWRAQTMPVQSGNLSGLSCASPAFCQAVGEFFNNGGVQQSFAAAWNGKTWTAQSPANPAAAGVTRLNAVSCVSASACEAVGKSQASVASPPAALAESWNGRSWLLQRAAQPPGATDNYLRSAACVTATFCEAVGTSFDGAGNSVNLAETWNGTSWTMQDTPSSMSSSGPTSDSLDSVSCVSAAFCEAVGTGSAGASAEMWNGTSWAIQTRPGPGVEPQSVSCATVDFCMTVGGFAQVDIWDGTSWSAEPSVPGFSQVSGLSCTTATFCEAVGSGPSGESAAMWDGNSWSAQPTPGPAGVVLNAVSCPAVNSCEATGAVFAPGKTVTLAETWNGSAWTTQVTPNPSVALSSVFNAVSCASADSCTAVGQYQFGHLGLYRTLAEVWDGKTWSLRSTPNNPFAGQNILFGVSCRAVGVCTAVGNTEDIGLLPATLVEAGD
jgi:hypothetical protein